jgi:hypothetical protein
VLRRRYATGPALLQTLFGLVFGSVLLSATITDYRTHRATGDDRLLHHPDPEIRAAAVYALGFHGPTRDRAERVLLRLDDRAPEVRQAAGDVLSRWSRRPAQDLAGIRDWAAALSGTSSASGGSVHP